MAMRAYVQLDDIDEAKVLTIRTHLGEFASQTDAIRWAIRRAHGLIEDVRGSADSIVMHMKLIVDLTDEAESALRELEQRAGFGGTRKAIVCAALESAAESARPTSRAGLCSCVSSSASPTCPVHGRVGS